MRLLFDENLSFRLVRRVEATYPDSQHVDALSLRGGADAELWAYAREHGLVLVSKDDDFRQLSFLYGHPPKVVWLVVGNAGTGAIADLLVTRHRDVVAFVENAEESLLILKLPESAEA